MQDFILFEASIQIGAGLPGDEEVSKLARDETAEIGKGLSSPGDLQNAERVLAVIKKFGGTDADLAATGFEDMFGPALANGTIGSKGARDAFVMFFPNTKYRQDRAAFEEAETKQAQERTQRLREPQAEQAREQAAEKACALNGDFTDLFETVRDIALERQQANFALAHSNMMRRPAQGRAAAQMVLGEANRILKEDFCSSKRDYLKKYGSKEFQIRVNAQCYNDPPVGRAEYGRGGSARRRVPDHLRVGLLSPASAGRVLDKECPRARRRGRASLRPALCQGLHRHRASSRARNRLILARQVDCSRVSGLRSVGAARDPRRTSNG